MVEVYCSDYGGQFLIPGPDVLVHMYMMYMNEQAGFRGDVKVLPHSYICYKMLLLYILNIRLPDSTYLWRGEIKKEQTIREQG